MKIRKSSLVTTAQNIDEKRSVNMTWSWLQACFKFQQSSQNAIIHIGNFRNCQNIVNNNKCKWKHMNLLSTLLLFPPSTPYKKSEWQTHSRISFFSRNREKEVHQNYRSSHRRFLRKKLFLKILQYSQEKTCAEVSF